MRKFKCIGLEEKYVFNWEWDFTIGNEYRFVKISNTGSLVLISNNGHEMYVDADQFEEVT